MPIRSQRELLTLISGLQQEIRMLSATVTALTAMGERQATAIEMLVERVGSTVVAASEPDAGITDHKRLDISEAARRLGVSTKTLRRALDAGAADLAGGPVDATPASRRHCWRFTADTLDAWWRRWGESRAPAQKVRSRSCAARAARAKPTPRRKKSARIDWAAASRGE